MCLVGKAAFKCQISKKPLEKKAGNIGSRELSHMMSSVKLVTAWPYLPLSRQWGSCKSKLGRRLKLPHFSPSELPEAINCSYKADFRMREARDKISFTEWCLQRVS